MRYLPMGMNTALLLFIIAKLIKFKYVTGIEIRNAAHYSNHNRIYYPMMQEMVYFYIDTSHRY